jgi:hypothetical protein
MANLWFQMGEMEEWKGYDYFLAKDAQEAYLTGDSFEDRERMLLKNEKIAKSIESTETKLVLLDQQVNP